MPLNDSVPVVPSPFRSHVDERPVTLFLDAEDAIRITVLQRPEGNPGIRDVLAGFGRAAHADRPIRSESEIDTDVWDDVAAGRALWQNAEALQWIVLVEGVDRVFSHQFVRQRIGVTFSQQCTGDRDCRHDDVLVPRAYGKHATRHLSFVDDVLRSKVEYALDVDSGLCVGEARRRLPHAMSTFVYYRVNLAALATFVSRRRDPLTQDWLTYTVAGRIRDAIVEASPWAAPALRDRTSPEGSWYDKVRGNGWSCTHLWSPKGTIYDNHEWNPETFVHGAMSHEEVSSGRPVEPMLFVGASLYARGIGAVRNRLEKLELHGHLATLDAVYGAPTE